VKGFVDSIEDLTERNKNFREVLYTGHHLQLVVMSIKKGSEIGEEVHTDRDQFFRVEKGKGQVLIGDETHKVRAGDGIVVPAGARHNVVNTGKKSLKLYTLYGPPEHKDGIVRKTKKDAEENEEHFDGNTSE
jgi:mannose-6-phosphate isomerase-like protein (cupin superfamily)